MALWGRDREGKVDRHRLAAWQEPVTLRLAASPDEPALERLADLDCRSLPPGPHLVAERAGRIDAALSLSSGGLVANPFRRTVELAALLRTHAGDGLPTRPSSLPRPEPRPIPVAT